MAPHISPGFLTPSAAKAIDEAIASASRAEHELQRQLEPLADEFPAKITAYDGATGRCSWTMRSYNANGLRTDHPNGRTGTTTRNPAYPTGNGEMPPEAFPVDVWLRKRGFVHSLGGPVYEFDWHCACTPEQSGSGSGGGSIETNCCPNRIAESLYATIVVNSGACDLDGLSLPLTYVGNSTWRSDIFTGCGFECYLEVACESFNWRIEFMGTCGDGVGSTTPTASCDPFMLQLDGIEICGGSCNITVTVTE